ncbi:MAG: 3-hydroxyacyl-CoA dehydrogenase NAD-binding domain-containing protein [Paracoccus sp. (in: a-proteobacteria)]
MTKLIRCEIRGDAMIVTIDNPPVNAITQAMRFGLLDAVTQAKGALEAGQIARVVVTGANGSFNAGTDPRELDRPPLPPHLQSVLSELSALPAIAAISGPALGTGCEIALACRFRIARPDALIGFPDVSLGLVPGAGGTQRLPRLIGLEQALPLIGMSVLVSGSEALSKGMVNELADDPLAAALALDLSRLGPSPDDLPASAPAPQMAQSARAYAETRQRGEAAPLAAIELMEASTTLPLPKAMAKERATFLELRASAQSRALRHVVHAERAAGHLADLQALSPVPVGQVLVVGGAAPAATIAHLLALAGIRVTILESDAKGEELARLNMERLFEAAVRQGLMNADIAARLMAANVAFIHGSDMELPLVDMVIDVSTHADLEARQAIFERLGRDLPAGTILAAQTSRADASEIAKVVPGPERFVGLHFFAPAHIARLVEVVCVDSTSKQTLATVFALLRRLNKIAVESGDSEGFIGDRIQSRYLRAADRLLLEGAQPADVDAAMVEFGMGTGPYAMQDFSGLDAALALRGGDTADRAAPILDQMTGLNRLGRKTNAGWYDYEDGKPVPSQQVADLLDTVSAEAGISRREISEDEISQRLALAIIAEGAAILDEGVARRPVDIDLVMIHGFGFPRWRGGPMWQADEWGLGRLVREYEALAGADPQGWAVPDLFHRLMRDDLTLSDLDRVPAPK